MFEYREIYLACGGMDIVQGNRLWPFGDKWGEYVCKIAFSGNPFTLNVAAYLVR